MKILKIINSKEEDIYSYTACISAVEFKKRGHEVDILTFPSDYVKEVVYNKVCKLKLLKLRDDRK
jgi:hypothetical protein